MTDLVIEELTVSTTLAQAWGTVASRPFQFRATRGFWTFAVFETPGLGPWDIDLPGEQHPGMYMIQPYAAPLTRERIERVIRDGAEGYLVASNGRSIG